MSSPRFRREDVPIAFLDDERSRRSGDRAQLIGYLAMAGIAFTASATGIDRLFLLSIAAFVFARVGNRVARQPDAYGPPGERGTIEVDATSLRITTRRETKAILLRDIDGGWRDSNGHVVVRLRDGREWMMRLDQSEGGALLTSLGFAGDRALRFPFEPGVEKDSLRARLSRFRSLSALRAVILPGFISLLIAASGFAAWNAIYRVADAASVGRAIAIVSAGIAGLVTLHRLDRRRWVTIGADGIAMESLFGKRFIPWTDIEGVNGNERNSATIVLRGGREEDLLYVPGGLGLYPALRAASANSRARGDTTGFERLDRGGRSVEAWRDDLARLASVRDGYRETSLAPERLLAIVTDPASPLDRRVGAAIVLRGAGEEASRVRIAIDACVEEDVKVALERAAEGEIAEDSIESAERRARR